MNDLIFKDKEHKEFFIQNMKKVNYPDVYEMALIYCLGINKDTRDHINDIYDFTNGLVKPQCLHQGWQTSGSAKVVRMAFNLYCNGTPSVDLYEKSDDQIRECRLYATDELFCCGYAPFFWEAIKLRYPEYTE